MSDQENEDNDTNEVKIAEPTSGTETQKTDDKLIITAGGSEYDDLLKEQWNLDDIADDDKRRARR